MNAMAWLPECRRERKVETMSVERSSSPIHSLPASSSPSLAKSTQTLLPPFRSSCSPTILNRPAASLLDIDEVERESKKEARRSPFRVDEGRKVEGTLKLTWSMIGYFPSIAQAGYNNRKQQRQRQARKMKRKSQLDLSVERWKAKEKERERERERDVLHRRSKRSPSKGSERQ